jgi:hypothetical protein
LQEGPDVYAYGFQVKIKAMVSCGDDITKARIKQQIFLFIVTLDAKGKLNGGLLTDATHDNVKIETPQYNDAMRAWNAKNVSLADDKGINEHLFKIDPKQPQYTHDKESVTYSDAPGYPGGKFGEILPANKEFATVVIRLAIKITATGTDGKTVTGEFTRFQAAKSTDGTWKTLEKPPAKTDPPMPITKP